MTTPPRATKRAATSTVAAQQLEQQQQQRPAGVLKMIADYGGLGDEDGMDPDCFAVATGLLDVASPEDDVVRWLERQIGRTRASGGADSRTDAFAMGAVARAYTRRYQYDKALVLWGRAVDMWQKVKGKDRTLLDVARHVRVIRGYCNIQMQRVAGRDLVAPENRGGMVLLQEQAMDQASKLVKSMGWCKTSLACLYDAFVCMAFVCTDQGDEEGMITIGKRMLANGLKALKRDFVGCVRVFNVQVTHMVGLYENEPCTKRHEEYFLADCTLPDDLINQYEFIITVTQCVESLGRYVMIQTPELVRFAQDAVAILEAQASNGATHPHAKGPLAHAHNTLILAYNFAAMHKERRAADDTAIQLFRELVTASPRTFRPHLVRTLTSKLRSRYRCPFADDKKLLALCKNAVAEARKVTTSPYDHFLSTTVADCLIEAGWCMLDHHQLDVGMGIIEEAVKILGGLIDTGMDVDGSGGGGLLNGLEMLGIHAARIGEMTKSIEYLISALEWYQKIPVKTSLVDLSMSTVLFALGRHALNRHDVAKAIDFCFRAATLALAHFSSPEAPAKLANAVDLIRLVAKETTAYYEDAVKIDTFVVESLTSLEEKNYLPSYRAFLEEDLAAAAVAASPPAATTNGKKKPASKPAGQKAAPQKTAPGSSNQQKAPAPAPAPAPVKPAPDLAIEVLASMRALLISSEDPYLIIPLADYIGAIETKPIVAVLVRRCVKFVGLLDGGFAEDSRFPALCAALGRVADTIRKTHRAESKLIDKKLVEIVLDEK